MSRIFISHSSRDAAAAAELRERLRGLGHRSLFLDFDPADGIPAGRDWERELYRGIRACRAVVVLCSRSSMASRWCFMEVTHARALGKELFPVRIDDCDLEGILADRQAIDLTAGAEAGYERLARGLLAAGLDPADAFDWDGGRPPYPGLLAFQEQDAAVFFGREAETGEGLDLLHRIHRLDGTRLVVILGASGTGKSSLMRAGLLPRLRRDPDRWLVIDPIRRRDDPYRELAAALGAALERAGRPRPWHELRSALVAPADEAAAFLLAAAHELRLASGRPDCRIVLAIDQLEELLAEGDGAVSAHFLTLIRAAVEHPDGPLVAIATLRSDFLGRLQGSPALLGLRHHGLSLGPMAPEQVAAVIERPAEIAGIELGPGLVQALLADSATEDALPLLAFTLRELNERYGADGVLTAEEYRRGLGGLQGAIAQAAEGALFGEPLEPAQETRLRAAFLAMVRVTEEGGYARQPVRWDDLPAEVHPLLERFVRARLLVSGGDAGGAVLEVAHEAIFRSWGRLRGWLEGSAEALRLRRELRAAAQSWERSGRSEDDLWRGGRLVRARELAAAGDLPLEDLEVAFVAAAGRAENARAAAVEARRKRVLRAVAGGAVAAILLALAALAFALQARAARADAERQALAAEERAREAELAGARALAAQNFAEHQRVLARIPDEEPGGDRARALTAIAPKYLAQAREQSARAGGLESALEAWRAERGIEPADAGRVFSAEVIRARYGSSLLVHYGDPAAPRHLLVDGGSPGVFREALRPRLEALAGRRPGGGPLPLDLVVSAQTDVDALQGLLDLAAELREAAERGGKPVAEVGALWTNLVVPDALSGASGLHWKTRLVEDARRLGVPVNDPFTHLIALPEAGAARVHWDGGLTVTVLGPPVRWLREFADSWFKILARQARRSSDVRLSTERAEVVETFASPRVELLPSPIEIVEIPVPPGQDESPVNLASIVLMLELDGRRMLLTADARSDVLLQALAQAGYAEADGTVAVDLLTLPHYGSDRNVSVEFFRRVRARHYVVQGNGRHGNPEVATFAMLFEARRGDPEPFTLHLSYAPEELADTSGRSYPVEDLCALFRRERAGGSRFEVVTPAEGEVSLAVDLLRPLAEPGAGLRNRACGLGDPPAAAP